MTEGPYTVTKVIRPDTYRLKDDNGNVLTNTWSREQLRGFFPLNIPIDRTPPLPTVMSS